MSEATLKRQNFNVTPEEEAELQRLREALGAASVKDALLRATRLVLTLAREVEEGRRIYTGEPGTQQTRLLIPDFEATAPRWKYLAPRAHSWKRQLFVKGRKLSAANVWLEMLANDWSPEQSAYNWDLPVEAVEEIVRYCEENEELIALEAAEEKRTLREAGVALTPEERLNERAALAG